WRPLIRRPLWRLPVLLASSAAWLAAASSSSPAPKRAAAAAAAFLSSSLTPPALPPPDCGSSSSAASFSPFPAALPAAVSFLPPFLISPRPRPLPSPSPRLPDPAACRPSTSSGDGRDVSTPVVLATPWATVDAACAVLCAMPAPASATCTAVSAMPFTSASGTLYRNW
ncbi:hypothetical protein COO60DRAFT_1565387, partial [Scenedesmus sp. NREL 46B-D3]